MWRPILLAAATVGCLGAEPYSRLSSPRNSRNFSDGTYIVGGEEETIDKVPYQLALEKKERFNCGASIISDYWALTAAHCVRGGEPLIYRLRSGSDVRLEGGELHQVIEVIAHESFDDRNNDYDVAILRVENPFNRDHIIGLAEHRPSTGTQSTVSGWGRLKERVGPGSKILRRVQVPIVDQATCVDLYGSGVTDRMLCAGYLEGGKDSCQGDSGGPLVVGDVQVGIVSKGRGCARKEFPGVYTDVAAVHEWIAGKIGVQSVHAEAIN